ncbi:hypothetical protein BRADI_3g47456v3 [Brachypodium distachyon]|uniref:Uncharacterized protein n=1 Tax=Brachypodium distachyon TaxID=15368 RepID=A0A0Q3QE75_BRADI|nr:hypothetical protein BRADI_3g47456v3 [Brachypodium distachyon]
MEKKGFCVWSQAACLNWLAGNWAGGVTSPAQSPELVACGLTRRGGRRPCCIHRHTVYVNERVVPLGCVCVA